MRSGQGWPLQALPSHDSRPATFSCSAMAKGQVNLSASAHMWCPVDGLSAEEAAEAGMCSLCSNFKLALQSRYPALHEVHVVQEHPATLLDVPVQAVHRQLSPYCSAAVHWLQQALDKAAHNTWRPFQHPELACHRLWQQATPASLSSGAHLSRTASAGPSCPCPMEISVRLPASTVLPCLRAYCSISLDGEYPGNKMKKMGVELHAPKQQAACLVP